MEEKGCLGEVMEGQDIREVVCCVFCFVLCRWNMNGNKEKRKAQKRKGEGTDERRGKDDESLHYIRNTVSNA